MQSCGKGLACYFEEGDSDAHLTEKKNRDTHTLYKGKHPH